MPPAIQAAARSDRPFGIRNRIWVCIAAAPTSGSSCRADEIGFRARSQCAFRIRRRSVVPERLAGWATRSGAQRIRYIQVRPHRTTQVSDFGQKIQTSRVVQALWPLLFPAHAYAEHSINRFRERRRIALQRMGTIPCPKAVGMTVAGLDPPIQGDAGMGSIRPRRFGLASAMICGVITGGRDSPDWKPYRRDTLFIPTDRKPGVITTLPEGMRMRVYHQLPGFQHILVFSEGGRIVLPHRTARGLHSKRGCHLIEGQE